MFWCYFDSASDALDARGEQVMREFVVFWTTTGGQRVEVAGHIDTAEEARRQHAVGERRARAVAEWLIVAGIPRESITITNRAGRLLMQPTPPNVSERFNRWVEIVRR
jgi:outer membrane protein OmpA-like peptidoglycan-associated protein